MSDILDKVTDIADRLNNRLIWRFARTRRPIPTERPIVSFTFDDVPDTAWTNGAAILEKYGARGTFYIAGGLESRVEPDRRLISAEGCRDLFARGHEIGCHTFSHHKIGSLTSRAFAGDLDRNETFLADTGISRRATNFAFPYNAASPRLRHVLQKRYTTCRASGEAINRGSVDPFMLKAVEIHQPEDRALGLTRWIDDVAINPGWLIFFTHDVSSTPTPYGCRPETLERLVSHATERQCDILPVCEALDRFGWQEARP
ncbi:polysaccharide deacetylase family protein [Rhizobium herbae]|uniref:Chitooligosaccharide deacetylase n=1 Tax=Rhizobium herbae TaxID=508661 RepID=A0ABS4EN02_9HYPH|nr:polysaccharide deacetylase family protein [Rhizobium herbae]MBP1859305.1 peptidoglycan/xylan/chitin deacetylase (PgdA/CDA1 family) [Rhizobium herbae]